MKPLARLFPANPTAYIMGSLYGANGRLITRLANSPYVPQYHIYEIHRATIPAGYGPLPADLTHADISRDSMTRGTYFARRYHIPWRVPTDRDDLINPICGPIRTQSQSPRFNMAYGETSDRHICPQCRLLQRERGIEITHIDTLNSHDPWMALNVNERHSRFDPVSGT